MEPISMKAKIDFLTLAVEDLTKSITFYRDGLGLPTEGIQAGNEDHCLFTLDHNLNLVLYKRQQYLALTGHSAAAAKSAGFIISYIADSKADVDAILAQVLKAGACQIGETQDESWGYAVNFADPDGHLWEITYMPNNA
jgi:predicted lactoylglutathione lyase